MSCSGVDEDYSISGLPPIPIHYEKVISWNGRQVQVLDPSHSLIGKGVTIPSIPDHIDDPSFFQRFFEVVTQLDLTEDEVEEILSDNEWILSEAWDFVKTNYHEDLTVEELLELRGLMFDTEFGRNIMCKSVWKRVEHGLRKVKHEAGKAAKKAAKKVKKVAKETIHVVKDVAHVVKDAAEDVAHVVKDAAKDVAHVVKDVVKTTGKVVKAIPRQISHATKKTCEYLQEHPKVAKAIAAVAIVVAAVALTVILIELAPIIAEIAAGLGEAVKGAVLGVIGAAADAMDKVVNSPAPKLREEDELLASEDSDPEDDQSSSSQQSLFPPKNGNKNIVEQFFDNLLKPAPQSSLYKPESTQQQENSAPAAPPPPVPPPVSAPSKPTPFKNEFIAYLENLQRSAIEAQYQPPANAPPQTPAASNPQAKAVPPPVSAQPVNPSAGFLANVFVKLQQALETIGRGMCENPELLESNSPVDLFNKEYADLQKSEAESVANAQAAAENNGANFLKTITESIQNGLKTIGRGMSDPDLLEFDSPLDPLNSKAVKELSEISIKNMISNLFEEIASHSDTCARRFVTPISAESTEPVQSIYFTTEGADVDGMLITTVNGMNNTIALAKSNAEHIRSLTRNNIKVHGTYNHTNGGLIDGIEIMTLNYPGYSPITEDLLIDKWTEFHEKHKHNPFAKILHICHSQGAAHTKNALMKLPEEIRNRIIVVAIAPAEVVPRELCYDSFNYASKKDIVPYGEVLHGSFRASFMSEEDGADLLNIIAENQNQIIWIEPDENATGFDLFNHDFQNPIFIPVIKARTQDYIDHKGEYR